MGNSCNAVNGTGKIGIGSNVVSNVFLHDTLKYDTATGATLYSGDSVVVICASYTGLNDIATSVNEVEVYPNPFLNSTTIVLNDDGAHCLELDDMMGRKIRTMECNGKQYELAKDGLSQGVYLLKIFDAQMKYISSL